VKRALELKSLAELVKPSAPQTAQAGGRRGREASGDQAGHIFDGEGDQQVRIGGSK
jgi:hypothetical protein